MKTDVPCMKSVNAYQVSNSSNQNAKLCRRTLGKLKSGASGDYVDSGHLSTVELNVDFQLII